MSIAYSNCPNCHEPLIPLMADCLHCATNNIRLSRTRERFPLDITYESVLAGIRIERLVNSYAGRMYYEARLQGDMSTEEFMRQVAALKEITPSYKW